MEEKLICKGMNDECRIYEITPYTANGKTWKYELRYNSLFHGDPTYRYETLKGAKIAMKRMANGIYKDLKPSTAWE